MLPVVSSSNQDLALLLHQKQMQSQGDPFSQLLKMSFQFNLLKALTQESTPNSQQNTNPLQLLSALNYFNQATNTSSQLAKMLNSHLTGLNDQGKDTPLSVCGKTTIPSETSKHSPVNNLEDSGLPTILRNKIPPFKKDRQDEYLQTETGFESLCAKSKKIKKFNVCGHTDRAHYAKGMCNQCYHKHGRTKKPWKCNHEKLYAHGLCQNCYINAYNKKRNQKVNDGKRGSNSSHNVSDGENDLLISTMSTGEPLTVEDKTAFGEPEIHQGLENPQI